jgi:hypothetical protein
MARALVVTPLLVVVVSVQALGQCASVDVCLLLSWTKFISCRILHKRSLLQPSEGRLVCRSVKHTPAGNFVVTVMAVPC